MDHEDIILHNRELREKEIHSRLKARIEGKCHVIYDASPRDKNGIPIDNLDEVAYHGEVIFEDDIQDFSFGTVYTDPTWLDVCIEANRIIKETEDTHHVFLEGIYEIETNQTTPIRLGLDLSS